MRRPFCFICFFWRFAGRIARRSRSILRVGNPNPGDVAMARLDQGFSEVAQGEEVAISPRRDGGGTITRSTRATHAGPPRTVLGSRTAAVNAKATILVVDDEPDVREVLEEYFARAGIFRRGRGERRCGAGGGHEAADRPRPRRHPHARRGRPEPRAAPARALREDRDRHADVGGDRRRPDRGPRDGRGRLRSEAVRPARARGAREERAAAHVVGDPRRHRSRPCAHRPLRARSRRASTHRRGRRRSADVVARVRPAEGARRASEPSRSRASGS